MKRKPVNCENDQEDATTKEIEESIKLDKLANKLTLSCNCPEDVKREIQKHEDQIHDEKVSVDEVGIVDIATSEVSD